MSEIANIFNTLDEIDLVFTEKSNFLFLFFSVKGKNLTCFLGFSR